MSHFSDNLPSSQMSTPFYSSYGNDNLLNWTSRFNPDNGGDELNNLFSECQNTLIETDKDIGSNDFLELETAESEQLNPKYIELKQRKESPSKFGSNLDWEKTGERFETNDFLGKRLFYNSLIEDLDNKYDSDLIRDNNFPNDRKMSQDFPQSHNGYEEDLPEVVLSIDCSQEKDFSRSADAELINPHKSLRIILKLNKRENDTMIVATSATAERKNSPSKYIQNERLRKLKRNKKKRIQNTKERITTISRTQKKNKEKNKPEQQSSNDQFNKITTLAKNLVRYFSQKNPSSIPYPFKMTKWEGMEVETQVVEIIDLSFKRLPTSTLENNKKKRKLECKEGKSRKSSSTKRLKKSQKKKN